MNDNALGSMALRRWWLVVIAALLAAAAAAGWSESQPRDYEATAEILVTPVGGDDQTFLGVQVLRQVGDAGRTVQTAAAIVDSVPAARRAAGELGAGWSERRVRDEVDVQAQGATNVVAVTGRADSPGEASRLATQFARSALDVRRDQLAPQLRAAVGQTLLQLRRFGDRSSGYVNQLRARLDNLRTAQQTGDPTLSLAEAAPVPTERGGTPTWMIVAAALLAGGLVGLAAAMVLPASRSRVAA